MRLLARRMWAQDRGVALDLLSTALAPTEWLYRGAVWARGSAYDLGILRSKRGAIPALAVGNLTVGGTGKTPLTAHLASRLNTRGVPTAVVLRGYGEDEVVVHGALNPMIPVYANPSRLVGLERAKREGAEVAVLDDAFQHRALKADAYAVLVAAEEWGRRRHLLPRGPWREPLSALERATLVIVTRKSASREAASKVMNELARHTDVRILSACIGIGGLVQYTAEGLRTEALTDPMTSVAAAVAGVARPETVWHQLDELGIEVGERRAFPDHHRFSDSDVRELLALGRHGPLLVTLKDAVKLGPLVDERVELVVPLQEVAWEEGEEVIAELLDRFAAGPDG